MNLGEFIAKQLLEAEDKQTIALFPGAFKPPTKGHFDAVQQLLKKADQVVVLISPKPREGITAEQSVAVWNEYKTLLNGNVEIRVAAESPVKESYDVVKNNPDTDFILAFGKDDMERFGRIKKYNNTEIYNAGHLEGVSATFLRRALDTDNEFEIEKYIPKGIAVVDFMHALKGDKPEEIEFKEKEFGVLPKDEKPIQESPPTDRSSDYQDYVLQNRDKIEKAAYFFNLPIQDMEQSFTSGREIVLTDEIWKVLENSKSYKIKTLDEAIQYSLKRGIDPKPYIDFIKEGKELPLPLVLCYSQNKYYLVGGDVVLSIFKALGSIPTVLQGNLDLKIQENIDLSKDIDYQNKMIKWFKNRWKDYSINQLKKELDKSFKNKGTEYLRPMIKDLIQSKRNPIQENKNNEKINIIKEFIKFAVNELKLKKVPKITLSYDNKRVKESCTFGTFEPDNNRIWVYVKNRNLADILRTVGHELNHRKQDEEGRINLDSGNTGSEIENEANAKAGILLRKFGQQNNNIYESLLKENYSLQSRDKESFGMKEVPKNVGFIDVNDNIKDDLIDKIYSGEFKEVLPEPWNKESLGEILLMFDEFDLLMPEFNKIYNNKQIARSLMQLFEAHSDSSLYINKKDFPQNIVEFEKIVIWLINNGIISNKSKKWNRGEGIFHQKSLNRSFNDIKLLKENLVLHATEELNRAGLFDKDADYGGMIGVAVLDLCKKFAEQGHSGFSAAWVRDLFNKLSNYETLTPITSDPNEWNDVSEMSGYSFWQNRRNPAIFSTDGGQTWYHVDDKKIKEGINIAIRTINQILLEKKNG